MRAPFLRHSVYIANICLSNFFLPLISSNFYGNMHAFRSPFFFQDTGCVHASMEWTPLQIAGGDFGDGRPSIVLYDTEARFRRL